VGKPARNHYEVLRHRWVYKYKMDLTEIGWVYAWTRIICLRIGIIGGWTLVNTVSLPFGSVKCTEFLE
jgi:hypothetical protein